MTPNKLKTMTACLVLAGIVSPLLTGCGGGESISNSITGTVATGRPYPIGTLITVQDATGSIVGTSTIAGNDGTYSVSIAKNAVTPFVITASADAEESLVSVSTSASGTANITPLTHLLAASLSPSGDPSQLANELKEDKSIVTSTTVNAKVEEIKTLINNVSGVTSNTTDNPLTTAFKADGTGMDRTLEVVKVKVAPQTNADGTQGATQIQIYSTAAASGNMGGMDMPITLTKSKGTNIDLTAQKLPTIDTDIAAIPDQGEWTFKIYGTDGTLLATETRRTTARIPTIAEARKVTWPKLTDAYRTLLVNKTSASGGYSLPSAAPLYVTADMTAAGGNAWDVPTGAWAPTGVKVYGSYGTQAQRDASPATTISFDDAVDVRSSWRKATIKCSGTDGHCASVGNYVPFADKTAAWTGFSQIQFNGYDAKRVMNTLSVNTRIK